MLCFSWLFALSFHFNFLRRAAPEAKGSPSSFISLHFISFPGRKKAHPSLCRDRSAAPAVPPCLALARPLTHTHDMPGGITAANRRLLLACAFGRPHGSIHNAVHLPHSTRRGSLEALCAATLPDHRFFFFCSIASLRRFVKGFLHFLFVELAKNAPNA